MTCRYVPKGADRDGASSQLACVGVRGRIVRTALWTASWANIETTALTLPQAFLRLLMLSYIPLPGLLHGLL
jgi:hypothetical protein